MGNGKYAREDTFSFYSIVYNSAYMLPELIITAIVAPVIYKAIKRTNLI